MIVIGFLIGILVSTQYKSTYAIDYSDPGVNDRKLIMDTLLNEQSLFKTQITTLREQLDGIQDNLRSGKQKTDLIEYINLLENEVGLKHVIGKGVVLILDDSPLVQRELLDVNNASLVHAADLRDVINVLRNSQVEAIAINDQRIISETPIVCVGNSILVNDTHLVPPFVISVIGEPEVIANNLKNKNLLSGIWDRINENKIVMNLRYSGNLQIPVYNGDFSLKYVE